MGAKNKLRNYNLSLRWRRKPIHKNVKELWHCVYRQKLAADCGQTLTQLREQAEVTEGESGVECQERESGGQVEGQESKWRGQRESSGAGSRRERAEARSRVQRERELRSSRGLRESGGDRERAEVGSRVERASGGDRGREQGQGSRERAEVETRVTRESGGGVESLPLQMLAATKTCTRGLPGKIWGGGTKCFQGKCSSKKKGMTAIHSPFLESRVNLLQSDRILLTSNTILAEPKSHVSRARVRVSGCNSQQLRNSKSSGFGT
eukprot:267179-Rhodomonas_salina.1